MDDRELKPCPFCGGAAEVVEADEAGEGAYAVQCRTRGCEASSAVMFALKEDVTDQLAAKWNRRAADDELRGQLTSAFVAGCCAVLTWTNSGMPQDDLDEAGYDYATSVMRS